MIRFAALLATASLAASPLAAQPAAAMPLSLEHRMLLRCSAAFAIVAVRQKAGDARALEFPPLEERGREFFVRASAKVMDETGLDRDALTEALLEEAGAVVDSDSLFAVMPACLSALEAAGL